MNIKDVAERYYEKEMQLQETAEYEPTVGDDIYCQIGDLLESMQDRELAEKIDTLILEMSDADQKDYFLKGFHAGVKASSK